MTKLCQDFLLLLLCRSKYIEPNSRKNTFENNLSPSMLIGKNKKNWNDSSNSLLDYLAYLQSFKLRLPPFAIHSQSKELSLIFDVVFKFCFRLQIKSFVRKPAMIDLAHLVYLYDFKSNWLYIAKLLAGNYFKIRFQKSFLFSFI